MNIRDYLIFPPGTILKKYDELHREISATEIPLPDETRLRLLSMLGVALKRSIEIGDFSLAQECLNRMENYKEPFPKLFKEMSRGVVVDNLEKILFTDIEQKLEEIIRNSTYTPELHEKIDLLFDILLRLVDKENERVQKAFFANLEKLAKENLPLAHLISVIAYDHFPKKLSVEEIKEKTINHLSEIINIGSDKVAASLANDTLKTEFGITTTDSKALLDEAKRTVQPFGFIKKQKLNFLEKDSNGNTPWHQAVENDYSGSPNIKEVMAAAKQQGYPINLEEINNDGLTPIQLALLSNHFESAKMLASFGADLNHDTEAASSALTLLEESIAVQRIIKGVGEGVMASTERKKEESKNQTEEIEDEKSIAEKRMYDFFNEGVTKAPDEKDFLIELRDELSKRSAEHKKHLPETKAEPAVSTGSIPKKLHAIWLGNVLDKKGQKNIADWKNTNKDYEVNLWIDSSLYSDEVKKTTFKELLKWAEKKNIIIRDIAKPTPNEGKEEKNPHLVSEYKLYKEMLCKEFFDDETLGTHKNLAAASDLLRVEILYDRGGLYFDAKDVFPGMPLGDLQAEYDFYLRGLRGGDVNNDILVSAPKGEIIELCRRQQESNYRELYQDEKKVAAHRNPVLRSPELKHPELDPRKVSTLTISGPGLVDSVIAKLAGVKGQHIKGKQINEEALSLDEKFFTLPPTQDFSWFDSNASKNIGNLIFTLRNYLRMYFQQVANEKIIELTSKLNTEEKKSFFTKSNTAIKQYQDTIQIYKKFIRHLNTPTTAPLDETFSAINKTFSSKEKELLNLSGENILILMGRCSLSLGYFEDWCNNKLAPPLLAQLLVDIGITPRHKYQLKDFVNNILNNLECRPNLDKLSQFGISPEGKAISSESRQRRKL